jgi:hypothetical protein
MSAPRASAFSPKPRPTSAAPHASTCERLKRASTGARNGCTITIRMPLSASTTPMVERGRPCATMSIGSAVKCCMKISSTRKLSSTNAKNGRSR